MLDKPFAPLLAQLSDGTGMIALGLGEQPDPSRLFGDGLRDALDPWRA
ncbi:MAG TPA: hypothetical protein VG651_03160 [Stellaceae bacterium]|nr:hypothetical protein [Stellaceae bacterium]